MKATIIIIVSLILITVGLYYAPKGNNYIQWEKDMIKIGQIKN